MAIAVDTNVLLDIALPNAAHLEASRARLQAAMARTRLVICEVVYAELASQFADRETLDHFLDDLGISLLGSTVVTLYEAGRAHRKFLGRRRAPRCPSCRAKLEGRARVLADFIIGAHALHAAETLLTRDRGFYRRYFQGLDLAV